MIRCYLGAGFFRPATLKHGFRDLLIFLGEWLLGFLAFVFQFGHILLNLLIRCYLFLVIRSQFQPFECINEILKFPNEVHVDLSHI